MVKKKKKIWCHAIVYRHGNVQVFMVPVRPWCHLLRDSQPRHSCPPDGTLHWITRPSQSRRPSTGQNRVVHYYNLKQTRQTPWRHLQFWQHNVFLGKDHMKLFAAYLRLDILEISRSCSKFHKTLTLSIPNCKMAEISGRRAHTRLILFAT